MDKGFPSEMTFTFYTGSTIIKGHFSCNRFVVLFSANSVSSQTSFIMLKGCYTSVKIS